MEGTIFLDKVYSVGYSTEYKFKINCEGYYNVCYVNEAPTGNCQLFTLTCVDRIFEFTNYEFLIKEIIKAIKKATYNVDINNTFLLCLSLVAFLLATRQLNVVGIPVVVNAIDTIRKLNNT